MNVVTATDVGNWLDYFGYLGPTQLSDHAALEEFKRAHDLQANSQVTADVLAIMNKPRCGVGDFMPAATCKWRKRRLTYFHDAGFNLFKATAGKAGRELSANMIADGFRAWEAVCPLRFTRTIRETSADIWIGGGAGKQYGFDGPGRTLAWAYMPCSGDDSQLESRFDTQERWGVDIDPLAVWFHELGHLLGLGHSRSAADIMYAYYNPDVKTIRPGDVKRIQQLYT